MDNYKEESKVLENLDNSTEQRFYKLFGIDMLLIVMLLADILISAWTIYFNGYSFFIDFIAYYDFGDGFYYGEKDYTRINSALGKWAYGPLLSYIYALLLKFNLLDDFRLHFVYSALLHSF